MTTFEGCQSSPSPLTLFNKKDSKEINTRMLELRDNRIKPNVEIDMLEKLKKDEIKKLELLICTS